MDTESQSSEKSNKKFLKTTFAIYFCYFTYGIAYNIWGPTWVDLVDLLDSNQAAMAYGNSLMAIGFIIGAFSGGFLFNYLNRQLLHAFYLCCLSVSTTLIPLVKSYSAFLAFGLLFGLGEGGFDTATNAWMMEMWGHDNGPWMIALYFFFGLGTLCSPLISYKFLDDEIETYIDHSIHNTTVNPSLDSNSLNNMTYSSIHSYGLLNLRSYYSQQFFSQLRPQFNGILNISDPQNTTVILPKTSQIYIPFTICGALCATSAILIITMYFVKKYEPILDSEDDQSVTEVVSDKKSPISSHEYRKEKESVDIFNNRNKNIDTKKSDNISVKSKEMSRKYFIFILLIGGLMLCFYEGMENINFEYLGSFNDNSDLQLSESQSALISFGLTCAYTIGRGIAILVAIKVKPKYFLFSNFILISIANAILYFYGNTSQLMVTISVTLMGLGFSTVLPSIYSYMEEQIEMTNIICGILLMSCASIATVDPIIVGEYISDYPYILLYINIGSVSLVMMAFMTIEITTTIRRNRLL